MCKAAPNLWSRMVRIHLTAVAGVGESFCPNQHLSAATIRKADQVAQKPPYCYERFRFAELATASRTRQQARGCAQHRTAHQSRCFNCALQSTAPIESNAKGSKGPPPWGATHASSVTPLVCHHRERLQAVFSPPSLMFACPTISMCPVSSRSLVP